MTRTRTRDLEEFGGHARRKSLRQRAKEYIILGIVNSAVVYLVYTPYVVLWLHLDFDQYVRWLIGGVWYSLATSWFFALVIIRLKKRWFPDR